MLSRKEFLDWARQFELFCYVGSRVEGEKYPNFIQEKKALGYHNFLFMDAAGLVLARHSSPAGVPYLERAAARARAVLDLRRRAAGGKEEAVIDYLLTRVDLFHVTPKEARRELASTPLSAGGRKLLDLMLRLFNHEIPSNDARKALDGLALPEARRRSFEPRLTNAEAFEITTTLPPDEAGRMAALGRLTRMAAEGRIPTVESTFWTFWMGIMEYAEKTKDPDLLQKAIDSLDTFRKAYWEQPAVERMFRKKEALVESLRKRK